jgi:hypothetical protein
VTLSANIIWAWSGADIWIMDNNKDCAFDGSRPLLIAPTECGFVTLGPSYST